VSRGLPSGTVTFLFTDVEGSTKLLHELGADEYAKALAEHRRILREAFGTHGGVEVDTQGDAFFVAFAAAPAALAAASAATEALAPGPIRVRMGIHTGTPLLGEEGYVGVAVHRAARIAAAGCGGQVLLSKATQELVDGDVSDLGEHRLKDFAEPVWLFQLGSERFPPLKTISNTNLPHPASSFVGREREVEELASLLQDGARLLTLTGPGGSGKTRLAIEAAAGLVPAFRNGVFWVGLAPLHDPHLVLDTVAQTLGAKDSLAEHIGERELLLLLDNLEQVIEAAVELVSLLEACPNLTLLVTSRELLRVHGEVEYPVRPLAEPEAVELFCVRSGLESNDTIAELCRRLDDLPLAVELAAARTSVLSPAQIVERLSKRLDLLKGGRDAEARQQTLRATIEWSYELLDKAEQRLFARLAVFGGGCTLEAAEEVAEADLDTLQSLVDKSLLRHAGERFWMLETIRDFAAERLDGWGEREALALRHATHFLALVESAAPRIRGATQAELMERLELEHDNVRAALGFARASGDAEMLARLAAAMRYFWWAHAHVAEGRAWLTAALAGATSNATRAKLCLEAARLADVQADFGVAAPLYTEAAALYGELQDSRGLASSLSSFGETALVQGDFERAEELCEEAVAVARADGDEALVGEMLHCLGTVYCEQGDYEGAVSCFEGSLARRQKVGGKGLIANSLLALGWTMLLQGDYQAARQANEEGLGLGRAVGEQRFVVAGLTNLAWLAWLEGDGETAMTRCRESLPLAEELGHRREIAEILWCMAGAAAAQRHAKRALTLAGAATALLEAIGSPLNKLEASAWEVSLAGARAELAEKHVQQCLDEGGAMRFDEAIAFALAETEVKLRSR
jgi:predicted ATPase